MSDESNTLNAFEALVPIVRLAELFTCEVSTIHEYRRGPDPIPAYLLGRELRFRLSEVEAWMQRRRAKRGATRPAPGRARVRSSTA